MQALPWIAKAAGMLVSSATAVKAAAVFTGVGRTNGKHVDVEKFLPEIVKLEYLKTSQLYSNLITMAYMIGITNKDAMTTIDAIASVLDRILMYQYLGLQTECTRWVDKLPQLMDYLLVQILPVCKNLPAEMKDIGHIKATDPIGYIATLLGARKWFVGDSKFRVYYDRIYTCAKNAPTYAVQIAMMNINNSTQKLADNMAQTMYAAGTDAAVALVQEGVWPDTVLNTELP